jgi:Zn-dependent peptidase ImmA (M78 family)
VPSSTFAHVTPEVLRWARESIGYSAPEAASKLGIFTWQLEAAEEGIDLLTLPQAEQAAELYDRPLAAFFRPAPPDEEPPATQFRRLPGAPEPPWPPAMHRLARRVRQRQNAAAELYDLLDEAPQWPTSARLLSRVERDTLASVTRQRLGVSLDEQLSWDDPSGYAPLRAWVDAVERQGVLVMQDGSMEVETLRGFASMHESVPAIVVNTRDHPSARAFTVIHEFGHLALAATGALVGSNTEAWCNRFAGEVLMPADALRSEFAEARGSDLERVGAVARRFGVTRYAAAVRIAGLGLLSRPDADRLIGMFRKQGHPPRSGGGGNYYRNKITWLGPAFVRLVLEAAEGQAVTLSNAAGLLEAKVDHFQTLRKTLDQRSEFE